MQQIETIRAVRKPVVNRVWEAVMSDFKSEFDDENIAFTAKVNRKTFAAWIYRLVVLAVLGFGVTDRVNVSKLLPSAEDVVEKLLVSEKFQPVLEKALTNALKKADEEKVMPPAKTRGKPGTGRPIPAPVTKPKGLGSLRDGEMITTKQFRLPELSLNHIPIGVPER